MEYRCNKCEWNRTKSSRVEQNVVARTNGTEHVTQLDVSRIETISVNEESKWNGTKFSNGTKRSHMIVEQSLEMEWNIESGWNGTPGLEQCI